MQICSPNSLVTIGDKFAEQLGYQEYVGAMAIIDDVMTALCGVTIVHPPEVANKHMDVHIEDSMPVEYPESPKLRAFVVYDKAMIYYTTDPVLFDVTHSAMMSAHDVRTLGNSATLEEIVMFLDDEGFKNRAITVEDKTYFRLYNLDDREQDATPLVQACWRSYDRKKQPDPLADSFRQQLASKYPITSTYTSRKKEDDWEEQASEYKEEQSE